MPFGANNMVKAEYDLDGWKVPDLSNSGELSYHVMRGAGQVAAHIDVVGRGGTLTQEARPIPLC
jgi:hypothetical protein